LSKPLSQTRNIIVEEDFQRCTTKRSQSLN
jgi:hypothetical protein